MTMLAPTERDLSEYLHDLEAERMEWAEYSPDLNPIEHKTLFGVCHFLNEHKPHALLLNLQIQFPGKRGIKQAKKQAFRLYKDYYQEALLLQKFSYFVMFMKCK